MDDYVHFVENFSPAAIQASFEIWTLGRISPSIRPVRRSVRRLVTYLVEQKKDIWEIHYYDPTQLDTLDRIIRQQLEEYIPLIEDGYKLNYVFNVKPDDTIIEQIENAEGNVYWGPDNFP